MEAVMFVLMAGLAFLGIIGVLYIVYLVGGPVGTVIVFCAMFAFVFGYNPKKGGD